MTPSLVSRSRLVAGIGAGLTAAATASLFAEIAALRGGHPMTDTYAFIASAVGGTALGESAAAVPIGIVALIAASILWAFGICTPRKNNRSCSRGHCSPASASASSCGS